MKCKCALLIALVCLLLCGAALAEAAPHVVENELLTLSIDPETLALTVTDKATGKAFTSGQDASGTKTNKTWTAFLASSLVIEATEGTSVKPKQYAMSGSEVTVDFTPLSNGADAVVDFTAVGQKITLCIRLEGDSITVTVPADGITEYTVMVPAKKKDDPPTELVTKLCGIYLLPNFGATYQDAHEGYILVPEAAGALIELSDGSTSGSTPFNKRVYGTNVGVDKSVIYELNRPAEQVTMPVYGIAYTDDQLAYLAIIEDGSEAAKIEAYPAGVTTGYNRASAYFVVREEYIAQTTRTQGLPARESQGYYRDMTLRFCILTGEEATYAGMARRYRSYLEERGEMNTVADIAYRPRLDFLAAESADFLLWNSVEKMTTVSQMAEILAVYQQEGIDNPLVLYRGWQPGGQTWALGSGSTKLEGKLGSEKDLKELAASIREGGGLFLLEIDPVQANPDRMYNMRVDVVRTIGQTIAEVQTGKDLYPTLYYLTPTRSAEIVSALASKWREHVDGIALTTLPNTLYSYYSRGGNHSRGETMTAYRTLLQATETFLALENPLAGYWGEMDACLDLPLDTTSYSFLSAEVPFLPMVLSGHVPYWSEWLNFESNTQRSLLKLVEYGAYPSWLITGEDVQPLIYTNASDVFSAQWNVMLPSVQKTDAAIRALHEQLDGAYMTDHQVLETDVAKVTWSNGCVVFVNYHRTDVTVNGITIPAQSWIIQVEGGEEQ